MNRSTTQVRIEPWAAGDLELLYALVGDPVMMEHLGGPESPEKIVERQGRYEHIGSDAGRVFKVVVVETGEAVGFVGYWEREWGGGWIYEAGWSVIPAFQGQGDRCCRDRAGDGRRQARWQASLRPRVPGGR